MPGSDPLMAAILPLAAMPRLRSHWDLAAMFVSVVVNIPLAPADIARFVADPLAAAETHTGIAALRLPEQVPFADLPVLVLLQNRLAASLPVSATIAGRWDHKLVDRLDGILHHSRGFSFALSLFIRTGKLP